LLDSRRRGAIMAAMEKPVDRILDANFNRAREALRTMEEYCRFILNDPVLSGRAKTLRDRLCTAAGAWERGALLSGRDSAADVGRGMEVAGQQRRQSTEDCFTAAAMRLSEALRVLAEFSAVGVNRSIRREFEAIRFDGYDLEKAVAARFPAVRFGQVRLYVLVTATAGQDPDVVLKLIEQIALGGADAIQLRAKGLSDEGLYRLSGRFVALCRDNGVLSIVNDRADIAAVSGADGLHLGQEDLPVSEARRLLLRLAFVGLSTHNEAELQTAIDRKADYAALGPMFASRTKPGLEISGLDYVRLALPKLRAHSIGHVAIGGIDLDNVASLIEEGIRAVAVGAAVCEADDPRRQTRAFKDKIDKLLEAKA